MAEVKWIKITTGMFDDEKIRFIESLPEADSILVIWIKLLTLCGKCNAGGYILLTPTIPYTVEMLANEFNRPLNIVKLAIETFIKLGMVETGELGFYLPNWEKHQNIDGLERIREQTRKRVAAHRERKKQELLNAINVTECNDTSNVTVTQCNAIDKDKELDIDKVVVIEEAVTKQEPPQPYVLVLEHFSEKSGIYHSSPDDIVLAKQLIADGIPLDLIIQEIDGAFADYKPKYHGDKIRTLKYCEGRIRKKFLTEQAKAVEVKGNEFKATSTIKSNKRTFNNFKSRFDDDPNYAKKIEEGLRRKMQQIQKSNAL